MQRRVSSDGHVGAAEVVVDGAHEPHDIQVVMLLGQSVCDPSWSTHTHNVQYEYIMRVSYFLRLSDKLTTASLPFCTSSASRPLHSLRKMLAPVRLPSPPHTHRLVMPFFTRLKAAASLPSRVVKALHRALPITVPPCSHMTNQNQDKQDTVICHKWQTCFFLLRLLMVLLDISDTWDGRDWKQSQTTSCHLRHICDALWCHMWTAINHE